MKKVFVRIVLVLGILAVGFLILPWTWLLYEAGSNKTLVDAQKISAEPNQEFFFGRGFILQVFDARSNSDSVIIRLLNKDRKILWTLKPERYDGYTFRSARFRASVPIPFHSFRLRASMKLKGGGGTGVLLYISWDGSFKMFRYMV